MKMTDYQKYTFINEIGRSLFKNVKGYLRKREGQNIDLISLLLNKFS